MSGQVYMLTSVDKVVTSFIVLLVVAKSNLLVNSSTCQLVNYKKQWNI